MFASELRYYQSGSALYGDDFSSDQITNWYEAEKSAYFDLMSDDVEEADGTAWSAVYRHHLFSKLPQKNFETCLTLGCADGSELAPIANRFQRIVAIEPGEEWWKPSIDGTVTEYRMPTLLGDIDLPDGTMDVVVAFGVLHHIPNVTSVLSELIRVCRPGGILLIREPIYSMGDWTKPRKNLTANERGIPLPWFEAFFSERPVKVLHQTYCAFPPLAAITDKINLKYPFSKRSYVAVDAVLSALMAWNISYHRDRVWKKFAPTSASFVIEKLP